MTGAALWIWFQQIFGPASRRGEEILAFYGHPGELWGRSSRQLREDGKLTSGEIHRLVPKVEAEAGRIASLCRERGYGILTPDDRAYPLRLRHIQQPPLVLYVQGELGEIDNEAAISIVGSRRCSDYGREAAGHLAQQLAQAGAVVVSGFAAGIDAAAHLGALRARGKTVAVLGCGLDVDYPSGREEMRRMIAATGALVTEYPPGTQPLSGNFPCRNRILSGLSLGVVVVEGNRHSGSLITAGLAAAQGRDVFAVPGSIFSPGSAAPHWLLSQGAIPAATARDILEEYLEQYPDRILIERCQELEDSRLLDQLEEREKTRRTGPSAAPRGEKVPSKESSPPPAAREKAPPPLTLSSGQRAVYQALEEEPLSVQELMNRAQLPAREVLSALTQLEIEGLAAAHPGKRYSIP